MIQNIKVKLHKWFDGAYYVGVVENADAVLAHLGKDCQLHINWINLKNYKGGWFADPFILNANDKTITLLVEEYEYTTNKGILSEIVVDRKDFSLLSVRPILKQDTHLSYPYYIFDNGKLLITPESAKRNEVGVYSFSEKGQLELEKCIIDDALLDTQLAKINGKFYAFGVKETSEGLDATKKLYIYQSDNLYGPYMEIQQIINTKNEERGAGLIFECANRLIRPAQNCNNGYGKGVILYELILRNGKFTEIELARFDANPLSKNGLCLHTFNVYKNLIAVDGLDYKCRLFARIMPLMYKFKAIFK